MSKSQRTSQTVQTVTTIDAGAHESSPPPETPSAPKATQEETQLVEDSLNAIEPTVANGTEVVEDSLGNGAPVAVNAPAQRPSQQAESEHDELYSLTPQRSRPKTGQNSAAAPPRKISNNALDALLDRGAKVHKPVQKPAETKQPAPRVEGTRCD